jgi:hypothetical protein
MYVHDHAHGASAVSIDGPDELIAHLRSTREGPYGAFILWHDEPGPLFFVHINQDLAYLHFFPDNEGRHPGFMSQGVPPEGCPDSVHFMQEDGIETEGIWAVRDAVVSVETACKAAVEFLQRPTLPASISWFEL